ncbi:Chromosomal replication initiator protein DnaA [Lignipirellula cremea]|uniref:Chromosomal replication initiator protein DnaA n=1 Tax=Lignipirellula cremea TaxID=2528010 RepID=A0A518DK95_9BACT|nr:Chromosomal replication initiator protein DnaA [Lignipirellula cremea]
MRLAEEFLAGEENALARAAAESFLNPSQPDHFSYNPWVLYGPTGVGKSLLAQGLLHQLQARDWSTLCIAGVDWAREYADAVETKSVGEMREKYQAYDYLLIEDLHEMAEKKPAQQELVLLIDALLDAGSRLWVTLLAPPTETRGFLPALASRLAEGLATPLRPPGPLVRKELLQRLATASKIKLSGPALATLVESTSGAPLELKQTLLAAAAAAHAAGETLSPAFLAQHLSAARAARRPSLRNITAKVSGRFQLKSSELKSATRRQAVVRARGVAMYIARQLTDKTLEEVGKHYGGRDHTTVLHACRRTEALLHEDPELQKLVEEIAIQLS